MAYEKIVEVARLAYEKTKSGKMKWEPTAEEDTFQTSFPSYSLLIDKDFRLPGLYALKICNETGQVIEELTHVDALTSGFGDLPELFEVARRVAMGVDKALDELLGVLKGPTTKR